MREIPAVSVVIPLYNAEKYIGECLDSILAQTFQNFEVVVVDDCSTDNSAAVVESYRERFGGRLTLSQMKKNSGLPSLPRNKGLILSRGEYVFFMDNDDFITKTALEELHSAAKNYDADVVYCEKYYETNADGSSPKIITRQSGNLVDKPTLETQNMAERVQEVLRGRYWVTPWCKLVRRNLLIEHEIIFPKIIREDDVWTWNLAFRAERFLRVPNIVYIYRKSEDSFTRTKRTSAQEITFWLNPVLLGLKALDKFMSKHEFFQRNLLYRYAILEMFVKTKTVFFLKDSFKLSPAAVYETIKREFGERLGEHDVLIAALCTALNTQQKIFAVERQKFNQSKAAAQKRIAELEAEVKRLKDKE